MKLRVTQRHIDRDQTFEMEALSFEVIEQWVFGHAVFEDDTMTRYAVERNTKTGEIRRACPPGSFASAK